MLAPIIVVSLGFADCRCCCGDVCVIPRQGFAAVDLRAKRHGVQSCARSAATRCDSTKRIEQMRALRVGHTMHLHIPSLIYYILYVLSGAQAHRDHAEDVWRASAPEDALLSTYPEGGVGLGMGGRGSVRPTFSTSSS